MQRTVVRTRANSGHSGPTLNLPRLGGGSLLHFQADHFLIVLRFSDHEPRISSGVSRWCLLRPNQTPSKTKATVNRSRSDENENDHLIEPCKFPKRIPLRSLPTQRDRSLSIEPPASWSSSHVNKEPVPDSTGRTNLHSSANCLAHDPIPRPPYQNKASSPYDLGRRSLRLTRK